MPGFTTLGLPSRTIFLLENKTALYLEFTTNAAVFKGQPVKLDVNGLVGPAAADDYPGLIIGYALFDAAISTLVTIITRGVAMVWALANAIQNAGSVVYKGFDSTHNSGNQVDYTASGITTLGYSLYGAATVEAAGVVTTQHGWALDKSVAQYDLIRVLLKN